MKSFCFLAVSSVVATAADKVDSLGVPCRFGKVLPVAPQKKLSAELAGRVKTYLPKAISKNRTFGVEIEFGGLNTQADMEALAQAVGGRIDGGMIHLKPDAQPKIVAKTFEKEGDTAPQTVTFEAEAVDGNRYQFKWESYGVLRTPGANWIEGIWSPEEALARVNSWKGNDVALKPSTFIRDSKIGDIDIHSEPVGKGLAGIEFVTVPLTYEKMGELQKVQRFLNGRAKGVQEGFAAGVHVNIGLQNEPVEFHPKILRRMILRWSAIRADVLKRFEPSSIRVCEIENNRPFYGDYSKEFLTDLKAMGEDGATKQALLALFDKHYAEMEREYRGKWFDVNPIPILMKGQSRIEFRLFNADFKPGQEKYLKEAVDLCLSMVEQAATEPLP